MLVLKNSIPDSKGISLSQRARNEDIAIPMKRGMVLFFVSKTTLYAAYTPRRRGITPTA